MSILEIELTPEIEEGLREQAKRRGLETKAYAQTVMLQDLLAEDTPKPADEKQHSVMEFHGVGREAWAGVDVQKYVDEMRNEWSK